MHHKVRRAVYAGSFDPPTNGHLWMIHQAAELFDELVVAIGVNHEKKSTYTVGQRKEMLRQMSQHVSCVAITSFENDFLVNYARSIGAAFIVRGIRTHADYEYERTVRHINADLQPNIQTVFLMPPREIAEVSSTMVKGLIGFNGWENAVKNYVPEAIYAYLLREHT